jgi:alkylhydroperoxidase/carboxymuconolactone decarboxylase family protein YurZ
VQLENHLRGSLMQGATPREVLEVILNSTAIVGMPTTIMTRRMLEKVMEEDGRGGELDLVS